MSAIRWKSDIEIERPENDEVEYGMPEPQIRELRSRQVVSYNTGKTKDQTNSVTAYTFEIFNEYIEPNQRHNEMTSCGILTLKHPLRNQLKDLSELSEPEFKAYQKLQ